MMALTLSSPILNLCTFVVSWCNTVWRTDGKKRVGYLCKKTMGAWFLFKKVRHTDRLHQEVITPGDRQSFVENFKNLLKPMYIRFHKFLTHSTKALCIHFNETLLFIPRIFPYQSSNYCEGMHIYFNESLELDI